MVQSSELPINDNSRYKEGHGMMLSKIESYHVPPPFCSLMYKINKVVYFGLKKSIKLL